MNYICFIYILCFSYIKFHPNVKAIKVYQADWESLNTRPVHKWFEDAKFGIFIHWGVYSVPAYSPSSKDGVDPSARYAEWYVHRLKHKSDVQKYFRNFHNKAYGENINYRSLAKYFKAELFDAKFWAHTFKSSGAKYVVLTSKHHDGYTLWPSKYSENWNAVAVGPGFDILKNLSHAVKSEGLKMGYYYSLLEWRHPWYGKNKWEMMGRYCTEHMIPQMKELINNYNPDILYGDGDWDFLSKVYQTPSFFEWLFNESPVKDSIVINDRWGKETRGKHGGYYTTEYDTLKKLTDNVENSSFTKAWEECRGIGASFGYNKNENLEDYSSSEQLIHILINKVSRGGNLLLNIGPTADGRIPVIMQQRLYDIGRWLKINSEAIYETRKWKFAPLVLKTTIIHYTRNEAGDLFVLVTKYLEDEIIVKNIPNYKIPEKINLIGYKGIVSFTVVNNLKNVYDIKIVPPFLSPNKIPCDYAWVYKIHSILKPLKF